MEFTKLVLLAIFSFALFSIHTSPAKAQDPLADGFVQEHNKFRAMDGVPPVTWNETVADYARNYASSKSDTCEMVHSQNPPYGECIAWGSFDMMPEQAVQLWADEKKDYNYDTNTCAPGKVCGHYTQVVWATSTQIGCAKVRCGNSDGTFINCNYYPPGNYVGDKPY
ncbi:pathogenesis-related protein 1-like [Argentina anserina]|uniref:pathogenesis-related protein 1-like n=1 Tax=Argentina anserina TaxID=57926 RepID=UPI002176224A|nr:pathogenesis-related protein 1-like [Potentilla anserina]